MLKIGNQEEIWAHVYALRLVRSLRRLQTNFTVVAISKDT